MKTKPNFRVGQVVAFKARQEVLYQYGRITHDLGTIYDYRGFPEAGWRIVQGNKFYEVPVNAMRSLTAREAGPRPRRAKKAAR
jgi:hypothetical protein